jgi:tetratricopeptide (TPR) repeat protein
MSSSADLQRGIEAARAGRKLEARDLLLKVVEENPRNELAWIWLSVLVDSLEDKITACENVLTINPANEKVRAYLRTLQLKQEESLQRRELNESQELLRQARTLAERGDVTGALRLADQATQRQNDYEDAWLLIAELSPQATQRIEALEKALAINSSNASTRWSLEQARALRDHPLQVAAHFEQMGKFDEALKVYNEAASRTKDSREFDQIYRHIVRIEGLKNEKIAYVAPRSSIIRLSIGWPLLYFFLVLVQVGLNPFAHQAFLLWLCLPLVALGSFLLALSEIRSKHALWQKLFSEEGDGSSFARLVIAMAGWMLVIFPHLLLLIDSVSRLQTFRIPPAPF